MKINFQFALKGISLYFDSAFKLFIQWSDFLIQKFNKLKEKSFHITILEPATFSPDRHQRSPT